MPKLIASNRMHLAFEVQKAGKRQTRGQRMAAAGASARHIRRAAAKKAKGKS